jgi:hypothetical protein
MSQRRGTTTNQLNHIIQVLQLGRNTGVLVAERGEASMHEVGEIFFVHGIISGAHYGEFRGQQAFQQLNQWGQCRFVFTPTDEATIMRALPARITQPLRIPPARQQTEPRLPVERGQQQQPTSYPQTPPPQTSRPQTTRPLWETNTGPMALIPRCPQRTEYPEKAIYMIQMAKLSRLHRHLFLLIDGQRTPDELASLLGRNHEEVKYILRDLEQIGVIRQ